MPVANDWEQFQSTFNRIHNKLVRDFFREDIDIDDEITTPEQHLKYACTCRDVDDKGMTMLRWALFQYAKQADVDNLFFKIDVSDITSVIGHPRVTLFFSETLTVQTKKKRKVPFTIQSSIRLMGEKFENAGDAAKIQLLRNKINNLFPESYTVTTGRHRYSYYDKANGVQLIEKMFSQKEAETHIKKVLAVGDVDWNEDFLKKHTTPYKNSLTAEKKRVLGEMVTQRRKSISTQVKLRQVELFIPGAVKSETILKRW